MSLPEGFRVRLAPGVRRADRGRLLVGGSPLTAMRLTDRAVALVGADGVTVGDSASRHLAERLVATNLGEPDVSQVACAAAYELTVVIPVRDRPTELDRALTALRPLHRVVVDDGSRNPKVVAEFVRRHGARLVVLERNAGPAGARNAGLATVTTPYVAFVDSDVEVAADDLLLLTRHFIDPQVALVGPRVEGVARSSRPRWFERYDAAASSLTLGNVAGVVHPGAAVGWLPSACLVGRTDAVAGGFDASLRVGEDVDLVWRLVESGARVRYDPSVRAGHDARPTVRGWLGRKFVYGSGGAGLAALHGDRLAPAVLAPAYAIAAGALLLRRRWSTPVVATALVVGWRSVRTALPGTRGTDVVAAQLALRGLGWALRQETALVLRHWWPLAALGAGRSWYVRRALVTALAVDAVMMLAQQPRSRREPAAFFAARRLDDLAYGAGLWWGCVRMRSHRALIPRQPGLAVSVARATVFREPSSPHHFER
jgi:mycofactocin glycosyltransferase